jgi:CheY-like chemotaxis protein
MSERIFVKVVGFADTERHALNSVFRLSEQRQTIYSLWVPNAPRGPGIALVDGNSNEARIEQARTHDPQAPRLLWVGEGAPAHAWRTFERPVNWPAVVQTMDEVFGADADLDLDFEAIEAEAQPALDRRVLVVDADGDDRLYLRAKLASLGLVHVDDAVNGPQAAQLLGEHTYVAALVSLDLQDTDPWDIFARVRRSTSEQAMLIAMTRRANLLTRFKANRAGCKAVLEKPLLPRQLNALLREI